MERVVCRPAVQRAAQTWQTVDSRADSIAGPVVGSWCVGWLA